MFYDTSVRLEPVQVAGINQAFRSLLPESVVGLVPGSRFQTWGVSFEQQLPSQTYFSVAGELLESKAKRGFGIFRLGSTFAAPLTPSVTTEKFEYREKSLTFTANQLIQENLALGASYRVSEAELNDRFPEVPPATPLATVAGPTGLGLDRDLSAILHQVNLHAIFTHSCGGFAQFESVWNQQGNRGYQPDIPGDEFWQFNAYLGYRFLHRHAEVRLGILNLTDQDYLLNPLNLHLELPRERTFVVRLKFNF